MTLLSIRRRSGATCITSHEVRRYARVCPVAYTFSPCYRRREVLQDPAFDPSAYKRLSENELDALPFGVIVVDGEGTIRAYNLAESRAAGIPRERVIGRNFFTEIAPCTQVRRFHGRFQAFVAQARSAVEPFEFVFPFRSGEQRVTILFVRDDANADRISIIVMRYGDFA